VNNPASPAVIVTGASRGIGWAAARWLGAAGATVILNARSRAPLEALAAAIEAAGGRAHIAAGDVADRNDCRTVVAAALERAGRIDALVNNAGVFGPVARVAAVDATAWQRNLAVNLLGPLQMIRECLAHLRAAAGRIVNVSSGAAYHPIVAASAYCCAKAALTHLTRILALEEPHLTVVAVRPGVVDTHMQAVIRRDDAAAMPPEQFEGYRSLAAEGRLLPPAVPARTIAWLALAAPPVYSGEFLDHDDPQLVRPAEALLGAVPADGFRPPRGA